MPLITPKNTKSTIEPTCSDYRVAFDLMKQQNKNQGLYFPITQTALAICKSLFLNNYEINTIISSYLFIWSKIPEKSFILKVDLESFFQPDNRGFIRYFFIEDTISCNDFVLFTCFFLFYESDDILSVLLSMCGVVSNLIITKDQVNRFLHSFGFDQLSIAELSLKLDDSLDVYDIKKFISHVKSNGTYLNAIHKLKLDIKKYTFDIESLRNIVTRMNYFNFEINNICKVNPEINLSMVNLTPPNTEKCYKKCYRVIFTDKPPPYHYDYCIDTNPRNAKINVLLQIKQRFGYSKRSSSTCFTSFSNIQSSNKLSPQSDRYKQSSRSNNRYFSINNNPSKILPCESI